MHKLPLIAAAILACQTIQAQTPAPPPAASAPTPATEEPAEEPEPSIEVVPDPGPHASRLLDTGSFENPKVKGRTPREQGGTPIVPLGRHEWTRFDYKQSDQGGKLMAGLTNEIARTGKQSLYIEFDKLTAPMAEANLASDFVSIQPGLPYHVGVWGRVDRKNPIAIDERLPYLRLEVDFFQADKETQTGDPILRLQPLPGSHNRAPMFTSDKWTEFFANVKSPDDAAYIKITWTFGSPPDKGEINGVMYFDDAIIKGEPGKTPEELAAAEPDPAEPAPEATPTAAVPPPTAPPPGTPAPATPKPKPRKK
jgi:hypothetical protein